MGRKSTREDKNIYQISREEAGMTRQAASLATAISESRIEKIEDNSVPAPDEAIAMAEAYKKPLLSNYYCTHDCVIGKDYMPVPVLKDQNLSRIVLELLSSLNAVDKQKEKLIEISADEVIEDNELADFRSIKKNLDEISEAVSSLQLWCNNMIAKGKMDKELIK